MKKLKSIEHYIKGSDPAIINVGAFREAGVNLTAEEAIFIGGLLYEGLRGSIEVKTKFGQDYKVVPAHPIEEALFEWYMGTQNGLSDIFEKIYPEYDVEKQTEIALSIMKKLEIFPGRFAYPQPIK